VNTRTSAPATGTVPIFELAVVLDLEHVKVTSIFGVLDHRDSAAEVLVL
jgi:hypothetical protein